jgi:hypothetical protein
MKIIDNTEKRLPFNTIPNGYLFECDGEIYMTTRPFKLQDAYDYNAVCMTDGLLYTFKPETEVVPVLGQLEIIKKGTYQQ